MNVADHPSDRLARRTRPREDTERREIRLEIHVGLFDAHEPLDRRAVEHDPAVERLLELPVGDLDVLDRPENVGELEAHELDLLALRALQDLRLRDGAAWDSLL